MNPIGTVTYRTFTSARLNLRNLSRAFPWRRGFWLLMALGHARALVGAWTALLGTGLAAERLGTCTLLTLSMAFFVLKLRDVSWLRWRADRRSFVALCMVIALLHANALKGSDSPPTVIPEYTALVVTTTFLVVQTSQLRRLLRSRSAGPTSDAVEDLGLAPVGHTIWLDSFRPHCWVHPHRVFGLRAPPA